MFAESRCWTEELLFVLIGIARMVDSATKHLVSRVRQSLDVHKNKRIRQKDGTNQRRTHENHLKANSSEYDLGWNADMDSVRRIRETW